MRRAVPVLLALALIAVACGEDATPATLAPTTTAAATTATLGPTVPPSSSTTGPTTTTPPTTTTLPGLPGALASSLVPWGEVGEGWALALYSPYWESDTAIYLISPHGEIYEVFTWPSVEGAASPRDLYDWRPDGRAVLVGFHFPLTPMWEIRLLDLEARTSRTVVAEYHGTEAQASFPRASSGEVAVRTKEGATERIEVRGEDGSTHSVLLTHPAPTDSQWRRAATWLYRPDGAEVIVADGASLQVVDGEGRFVRQLDAPGVACRPIRWWDAATFLARCIPDEVLDYLAYPVYGRLWLVPADGSPATALTALPADPVFVGDFGFADAWRWGDGVYANWEGDCGAAAIHLVRPDGTTELFDVDPESFSAHQIVGTVGSDLLIRRMGTCGGAYGSLHLLGPGGADWRDLIVPPTNETWGVIDALVLPVEP